MKKDMTAGKEWKLILIFTLPIMAGNLLQQLYNTVDGIIVGNFVGKTALAAVGTSMPLTMIFLGFAMGMSLGVGIVISQYFGAGRHDELAVAVDTALLLLGALGIVFTGIALLISPFLLKVVLVTPEHIVPHALSYFRIYALGLFFQFIYNSIAFSLRALGDSRATLYFLLIATGLNIILDLLFVAAFQMGVMGAAIATVISQIVCAAVSYVYLRRRFPYIRNNPHFNGKICKTMFRLGLPPAIQQMIVASGNGAMTRLVNGFGEDCMAAFTAGTRLDSFMFVPIMGFQSGLANFVGQNIGAGRLDRVRRGLRATLVMSVATTIVISVLLYFFAKHTVGLFGLEDISLDIGIELVRFMTLFFWLFSAYMSVGGVLQGAGDTIVHSCATLTSLIVRILLSYVGVYIGILGYNAAWFTTPIGWVVAIAIAGTRYFTGGWKKKAVAGRLSKGQIPKT